jgi:hypothetical protein
MIFLTNICRRIVSTCQYQLTKSAASNMQWNRSTSAQITRQMESRARRAGAARTDGPT